MLMNTSANPKYWRHHCAQGWFLTTHDKLNSDQTRARFLPCPHYQAHRKQPANLAEGCLWAATNVAAQLHPTPRQLHWQTQAAAFLYSLTVAKATGRAGTAAPAGANMALRYSEAPCMRLSKCVPPLTLLSPPPPTANKLFDVVWA